MPWLLLTLVTVASDTLPVPRFLEGAWEATNITFVTNQVPQVSRYEETMVAVNDTLLRVVAHGAGPDGEDLTRLTTFRENGSAVVMAQRAFVARGERTGNVLTLSGEMDGTLYRFRLTLLGVHYIYEMDEMRDGLVVRKQISYLTRVGVVQ